MAGWTLNYKAPIAPVNPQSAAIPAIQASGRNNVGAAIDVASAYLRDWTDKSFAERQQKQRTRDTYNVQSTLLQEKFALQGQLQQEEMQQQQAAQEALRRSVQDAGNWLTGVAAGGAGGSGGPGGGATSAVQKVSITAKEGMGLPFADSSAEMDTWLESQGQNDPELKANALQILNKANQYRFWTEGEEVKAWNRIYRAAGGDMQVAKALWEHATSGVLGSREAAMEKARQAFSVSRVGSTMPQKALGSVGIAKDTSVADMLAAGSSEPFQLTGKAGVSILEDVFGAATLATIAEKLGVKGDVNGLALLAMSGSGNSTQFALNAEDKVIVESTNASLALELNRLLVGEFAVAGSQSEALGVLTTRGTSSKSEARRIGSARAGQAPKVLQEPGAEAPPEQKKERLFQFSTLGEFLDE